MLRERRKKEQAENEAMLLRNEKHELESRIRTLQTQLSAWKDDRFASSLPSLRQVCKIDI